MRVLIVKTSSLGDIIHTFPAVTDAVRMLPGIRFDWVVEESFEQIPRWHPAIDDVIPSATRRWRKSWIRTWLDGDWKRFLGHLQRRHYDRVIDAQGLIKSAMITRKAHGVKHGLDRESARESQASRFYNRVHGVDRNLHAIERVRRLFAAALEYSHDDLPLDYGLQVSPQSADVLPQVVFLHGTTWDSKRWPAAFWQELARAAETANARICLPAGNDAERQAAQRIVEPIRNAAVLEPMGLDQLAAFIAGSQGVVAVDTGLAHVAAALGVPVVGLYGATTAGRTGVLGARARSLQASIDCSPCLQRTCRKLGADIQVPPCMQEHSAQKVWQTLAMLMEMTA